MDRIYYLSTCDTCKRIINSISDVEQFELIDIKTSPISSKELDWIQSKVGSYESLFNKRSKKFREVDKDDRPTTEKGWRDLILTEYTFLIRPIIVFNDHVYAGNAKAVVSSALAAINNI